jgi:hypothetical protein
MIDGPEVTINAEWPEVVITQGDDTPQILISAPPAPQLVLSEVGMRGPSGVGATLFEESFTDSNEWIVNHNFGRKPTAVQVLSTGGVEILADIVHISDNQLRVFFVLPFSGVVRAT